MTFIVLFIAGVLELQGACYSILNKAGKLVHKNLTMKHYWLSALLIGIGLDITYFAWFIFSR